MLNVTTITLSSLSHSFCIQEQSGADSLAALLHFNMCWVISALYFSKLEWMMKYRGELQQTDLEVITKRSRTELLKDLTQEVGGSKCLNENSYSGARWHLVNVSIHIWWIQFASIISHRFCQDIRIRCWLLLQGSVDSEMFHDYWLNLLPIFLCENSLRYGHGHNIINIIVALSSDEH